MSKSIGDGVYADYDGYHVILTTEDGISVTNRICLEGEVLLAFKMYTEGLVKKIIAEDRKVTDEQ